MGAGSYILDRIQRLQNGFFRNLQRSPQYSFSTGIYHLYRDIRRNFIFIQQDSDNFSYDAVRLLRTRQFASSLTVEKFTFVSANILSVLNSIVSIVLIKS